MPTCTSCGVESPAGFRFCPSCGATLAEEPLERRKVATILFCDMSGSTALGEQLDPEALRDLQSRYFRLLTTVIERHGGTVEKFIGDAVMAVFGIPHAHEDDALRAVRAASELPGALTQLNDDLERGHGLRIAVRIGVNTGEVVSGESTARQALATGDAVNVAARLEQAAGADDVLFGDATYRLVRDAVEAERVEPLSLKGKSDPVPAWRLVALSDGLARVTKTPFVGREHEVAMLREAFEQALATRSCRLCTVVGPAGIGKSRLVRELVDAVADEARVVVGRCLPYGEGITYWPLAEIVRQVGGDEPEPRLEALLAGEEHAAVVVERIAAAIGRAESAAEAEETPWAFRKLFEALGRDRPLVAVIDDIHWAEPTLLDLLEYLVSFSAESPILLVCPARPDLFESRPSWVAPRENASLISLQPLTDGDSQRLIERMLSTRLPDERTRTRIVEAAEGNPLFVEQMLALHADNGGGAGDAEMPPTIQALLAARIDRLEQGERTVLERASVEGRTFHRGAVANLLPEGTRASVGSDLMSLIRKELIRPGRPDFAGDDGFRFGHILIRDAAYGSVPKQVRAELHERFADWLERKAGKRIAEYEEILGYHLEQAYRYRTEFAAIDERGRNLGARAAETLALVARRAFARGDLPAAMNLLERAVSLLPESDRRRLELLPRLGEILREAGEFRRAEDVLREAVERAAALGDRRVELHARLERDLLTLHTEPESEAGSIADNARSAIRELELERERDHVGLAKAWFVLAEIDAFAARVAFPAAEQALAHAREAGDDRQQATLLSTLAKYLYYGPTQVGEALDRCQQLGQDARGHRGAEAGVLLALAGLRGLHGDFDVARTLYARSKEMLGDLGLRLAAAGDAVQTCATIELLAGAPELAEQELRWGLGVLEDIGERNYLPTVAALLGGALAAQQRHGDALPFARMSAELAAPGDVYSQALWRSTMARALAANGSHDEAKELAREAVRLSEPSGLLQWRGEILLGLAEVLRLADRVPEALDALRDALGLFEQKGSVVAVQNTRKLIGELEEWW